MFLKMLVGYISLSLKEDENYLQNGHWECDVNLHLLYMWSVASHQKMQECWFVLHFIYILHNFLRGCSVKLVLFERENPAAGKITKI